MKRFSFILFLISFAALGQQTVLPVQMLTRTETKTDRFVGYDAFGWQYTIAANEFRKSKDSRQVTYKAVQLGDLARADLQNPLQLLLFYKDFNAVVLLDNQLNETRRFLFSDLPEPFTAEAVGLASQNRLWIYNMDTQKIGLFDTAQKTLKAITPALDNGLLFYQSDYNYFYWIDNLQNCYRTDVYGKVDFLGVVPAFNKIQILSGTQLLMSNAEGLFLYTMPAKSMVKIAAVEKSFRNFQYAAQILSIFTGSEIVQYKINIPN